MKIHEAKKPWLFKFCGYETLTINYLKMNGSKGKKNIIFSLLLFILQILFYILNDNTFDEK